MMRFGDTGGENTINTKNGGGAMMHADDGASEKQQFSPKVPIITLPHTLNLNANTIFI